MRSWRSKTSHLLNSSIWPILSLLDVATKLGGVCTDDVFAEKIYAESLGVACIEHLAKTYRGSKEPYFPKGKLNPYQFKASSRLRSFHTCNSISVSTN